jgi:hypothetical protein
VTLPSDPGTRPSDPRTPADPALKHPSGALNRPFRALNRLEPMMRPASNASSPSIFRSGAWSGWVLPCLVAIALTGCYRVTVNTGAPPAPTQIDEPWQMSFAAGLVPPSEIDTQAACPQGIAQVQTQRSFLNLLATGVTSSIISPMHVTVTCAAQPMTGVSDSIRGQAPAPTDAGTPRADGEGSEGRD